MYCTLLYRRNAFGLFYINWKSLVYFYIIIYSDVLLIRDKSKNKIYAKAGTNTNYEQYQQCIVIFHNLAINFCNHSLP